MDFSVNLMLLICENRCVGIFFKEQCHLSFFLFIMQSEENVSGMTSFREVLEKMLVIVVLPVRNSLRRENELFSSHLVSNTCGLLASIVSELTASSLGSEVKLL